MHQLDLPFWPEDCLKCVLSLYFSTETDGLSEFTVLDYEERANWLMRLFGEETSIREITYARMVDAVRKEGPSGRGLLNTTIKRRLIFYRAVAKMAAKHGIITKDEIPELPRLKGEGRPRTAFLTVDQFRTFRDALAPGRWRRLADMAFWTGHHNQDLYTMQWAHFDTEYEWRDEATGTLLATGRYWRRNRKNPRCVPSWIPMEPEFRAAVLEWLTEESARSDLGLVVGRCWAAGIRKAFHAASDRSQLPRVTLIDLRRSFARMLTARKYEREYVRIAMGHEGVDSRIQGGASTRPAILERHYLGASNDLFTNALKDRNAS